MRDHANEDRKVRERLERNSIQGPRANRVGDLNKAVAAHAERELPVLAAIGLLRVRQSGEAARSREARQHNRAHDDWLRRTAAPIQGAKGCTSDAVLSPERRQEPRRRVAAERPDFANQDDARDERFVTPIREGETYNRLRDPDGAFDGGGSTEDGVNDGSDHWKNQGVHDLGPYGYGGDVLSHEDMRHLAAQKWRQRFFK